MGTIRSAKGKLGKSISVLRSKYYYGISKSLTIMKLPVIACGSADHQTPTSHKGGRAWAFTKSILKMSVLDILHLLGTN